MHGTLKSLTKCAECGQPFQPKRCDTAEFCSKECRQRSNNREMQRGKALLSLYVHTRFNRKAAAEKNLQTLIDRMVSNWVEEDRAAGRRVMRDLDEVMYAAVEHTAQRSDIRAGK